MLFPLVFFFNDTATTEIYTLSLHDALPISQDPYGTSSRPRYHRTCSQPPSEPHRDCRKQAAPAFRSQVRVSRPRGSRSEEHTSELQSRQYLVCRLLLEKKK